MLPCLNEGAGLIPLAAQIEAAMSGSRYEAVFVDDGSTDDTWLVIQEIVRRHPHWQGLRLTRRFGHQAAVLAGLQAARGEALVTMDADGQHPPRLIPEMLTLWRQGAKVVQTIRPPGTQETWCKRVASGLFYRLFSLLCDVPVHAADFRLLDRRVVDAILGTGGPLPFLRGLIPWMGWPTAEIAFVPEPRLAGKTKYSLYNLLRLAFDGIMSFSIVPLRLGIWAGLLLSVLSFAYLGYIAGVRIFADVTTPGWASIAGLLSLLGGVQLLCIGLLGEYLGRLYVASLDRPRYIVAESIVAAVTTSEECIRERPVVRRRPPGASRLACSLEELHIR